MFIFILHLESSHKLIFHISLLFPMNCTHHVFFLVAVFFFFFFFRLCLPSSDWLQVWPTWLLWCVQKNGNEMWAHLYGAEWIQVTRSQWSALDRPPVDIWHNSSTMSSAQLKWCVLRTWVVVGGKNLCRHKIILKNSKKQKSQKKTKHKEDK